MRDLLLTYSGGRGGRGGVFSQGLNGGIHRVVFPIRRTFLFFVFFFFLNDLRTISIA